MTTGTLNFPSVISDTIVARSTTDTFTGLKSFVNTVEFLSPVIDQDTSRYTFSGDITSSALLWQSFTPATSGYLYSIYINSQSLTGALINTVMNIYLGQGLGTILTSTPITISNTSSNTIAYFTNNSIYLSSSTQYTFNIGTG